MLVLIFLSCRMSLSSALVVVAMSLCRSWRPAGPARQLCWLVVSCTTRYARATGQVHETGHFNPMKCSSVGMRRVSTSWGILVRFVPQRVARSAFRFAETVHMGLVPVFVYDVNDVHDGVSWVPHKKCLRSLATC